MLTDLRNLVRYGTLVRCYLAEDSKRVTSSTFKVYIPTLMSSIENTGEVKQEEITVDRILNEEGEYNNINISLPSYIEAKSNHGYMHRLDGWIPEFKTQKSTYEVINSETGTISKIEAASTKGSTDSIPQHPAMPITKKLELKENKINTIEWRNNTSDTMVHTNSTEVDFQELNRYFIKRGHPMIGVFLEGEEFEFRILFIDGVTPYLDEIQDKGEGVNGDNPFNFRTPDLEGGE